MKIKINLLSHEYEVRNLSEDDIEDVYGLCAGNPLYYEYCPPFVTKESILRDMAALPPDVDISDKYFVGFYENGKLAAVMDLVGGYPQPSTAFVGFFMTAQAIQKNGIGSAIIQSVCGYLSELGFHRVRLAWVKGNPQSEHFWIKNHFVKIGEASSTAADEAVIAERLLEGYEI